MANIHQLPTESAREWFARLLKLCPQRKSMHEARALTCALSYARYRLKCERERNGNTLNSTPNAKA